MFYSIFLLCALAGTLYEASVSGRNSRRLIQEGAVEIGQNIFPVMAGAYGILYFGSAVEYWWFQPTLTYGWIIVFLGLFLLAKGLKFWAVVSLGRFWTMRVLIVPNSAAVTRGPYRWIRHPNYVAVIMEILAISLLGKSWRTGLFVITVFSVLLYYRISGEEKALRELTDYSQTMDQKRRFFP